MKTAFKGFLLAALLWASPALAQWQTPNYSVPIGRGSGTGFKSVGPCSDGNYLVFRGTGANPSCATGFELYDNGAAPAGTATIFHKLPTASPSVAASVGKYEARANNSSSVEKIYSQIETTIGSPTASSEAGVVTWKIMVGGTLTTRLTLNSTGVAVTGALSATTGTIGGVDIVTISASQTLTNKSFALGSNTLTGTIAQFNTALTDADFATLAGTETLTNKTLTAPIIATIVNTGTLTLPTSTDTLVGRATTDTLTNKTLTSPTINSGTLSGTFAGSFTASGVVTLSNATASTSTSTGALVISTGGLGVGGATYTGTAVVGTPTLTVNSNLEVYQTTTSTAARFFSSAVGGGAFVTSGSNLVPTTDFRIGTFAAVGVTTGTTAATAAAVSVYASENWDSTHAGSYVRIDAVPTGGSTSRIEVARFSPQSVRFYNPDPGATDNMPVYIMRDSASPAINDLLGSYGWRGRSTTGVERTYVNMEGYIVDQNNTFEDGFWQLNVMSNGTLTRFISTNGNLGLTQIEGSAVFQPLATTDTVKFYGNSASGNAIELLGRSADNVSVMRFVNNAYSSEYAKIYASATSSGTLTISANAVDVMAFKSTVVNIPITTVSTTYANGAFVVAGGVGIAGQVNINNLLIANTIRNGGATHYADFTERTYASGGLDFGVDMGVMSAGVLNLAGGLNTGSTSGGVNMAWYASGWNYGIKLRNAASQAAGRLDLMPDQGYTRFASGKSTAAAASAVPLWSGGSAGVGFYIGTGDPNGSLSAVKGSVYIRTDATTTTTRFWINTDGSTTWASVTTSSWLLERDLHPVNDNRPVGINLAA